MGRAQRLASASPRRSMTPVVSFAALSVPGGKGLGFIGFIGFYRDFIGFRGLGIRVYRVYRVYRAYRVYRVQGL